MRWFAASIVRMCRLQRNERGTAAIEFALMAPMMMIASLGTLEISRAVTMHKKFQRATAMVGDLIAREEQLGTTSAEAVAELNGIMAAATNSLRPYSTSTLKVGVISIRAKSSDANNTRVEWSYGFQGKTVPSQCALQSLPSTGMITAGNAAIQVNAEYTYSPVLANLIPGLTGAILWTTSIVNSPRNSCVDYAGRNCTLTCSGW